MAAEIEAGQRQLEEHDGSPIASTSLQSFDAPLARPSSETRLLGAYYPPTEDDPFKDPPPVPLRSADRPAPGPDIHGPSSLGRAISLTRLTSTSGSTGDTGSIIHHQHQHQQGNITAGSGSSGSAEAEPLFPVATPIAPGTSASKSLRSFTFVSLTSSQHSFTGRRSHESQHEHISHHGAHEEEQKEKIEQLHSKEQPQTLTEKQHQRHSQFIEDLPEFRPYHMIYPSSPHRRQMRSPTRNKRRSNATPPRTPSKPHHQQHTKGSRSGEKGMSYYTSTSISTHRHHNTRNVNRQRTWKAWLLGSCIGTPTSGRSPRQTPTSSPAHSPPLGSPVPLPGQQQQRQQQQQKELYVPQSRGAGRAPALRIEEPAGIVRRPSKLKKRPPETLPVPLSRRGSSYGEWRRSMIDQVSADVSRRSSQRSKRSNVSRKNSSRSSNATLAAINTTVSGSPASAATASAVTRRRLMKRNSQIPTASQRYAPHLQQSQSQPHYQQNRQNKHRQRWYRRILGIFICSGRKSHLE